MVQFRAACSDLELFWTRGVAASKSQSHRKSILSARPSLGIDPNGTSSHSGNRHRLTGGNLRCIFNSKSICANGISAAPGNLPHLQKSARTDLCSLYQLDVVPGGDISRIFLPEFCQSGCGLWCCRHGHHDNNHYHDCFRHHQAMALAADRGNTLDCCSFDRRLDLLFRKRNQNPTRRLVSIDDRNRLFHRTHDMETGKRIAVCRDRAAISSHANDY